MVLEFLMVAESYVETKGPTTIACFSLACYVQ